ncbi:nitrilase [Saprolegnia diclina VS20]|uniref:Nitrilase n=1 Tax=Saprolegnia diclina (strain VS20) TaxID=1156394 RepID=T0QSV5_SAPDV|nr:nitrilase [Saprolegnia diclina VS20]EQC41254.1 nitrilase [Saprolegnia diclina VS20]|eukprot:XP_008604968.1 nitrilase [Saprolegnia diclina VS20]
MAATKVAVAAVQLVSRATLPPNMAAVRRIVGEAAAAGASIVVLPEYWGILGRHETDKVGLREALTASPVATKQPMQHCMRELAQQHQIWLIGGTIPLECPSDATKVLNTMLVYSPSGDVVGRYDKVHLFGFTPGGNQAAFDEARTIVAGPTTQVPVVDLPCGRVGLSVCYDLRFPEFYRAMGPLALAVVPAAFTHVTGEAHWEILLRARAIENQCYVLASAQGGVHENGRRTWGQSMLIDPWGQVISELREGEGFVLGDVDLDVIHSTRAKLPALDHRRM